MEIKKKIIKINERKVFKFLNIISIMALIVALVDTIMNYSRLPENVPMHLNFSGQFENYSSDKSSIFIYIVLGIIIFIVTKIVSKFPAIINYPVKITDENRERQYKLASKFIRIFGFEIAIGIAYIQFTLNRVLITGGGSVELVWFFLILIGSFIVWLIKANSIK